MQSPCAVLSILRQKSQSDNEFKFKRLYRNLYNADFFYQAYSDMAPKQGNMTPGTDGKTLDSMTLVKIENLIKSLRDFSYHPKPVKRVYIPKKSDPIKKRPLGIPSTEDKMVQYVVKYILEALYEPHFSDSAHGFRPNRSCHTALREVKIEFRGVKWFIEGDIRGFFDNIDHHVLVNILRKKISDENLLGLIWKFLKAGYLEDWQFHKTFSGTPQGGIVSPILANIYLNELDKYVEEIQQEFNIGVKADRMRNQEARRIELQITRLHRKMREAWGTWSQSQKQEALQVIKKLRYAKLQLPYYIPFDTKYKRLKYVRYADDFLIGIDGSKQDAVTMKQSIKDFLQKRLKLELSDEKTLITHSGNKARFLGYDVVVRRDNAVEKDKLGQPKRKFNYSVGLYIPHEMWVGKLLNLNVLQISKDIRNKEVWKPIHRPELAHLDDLEILMKYNAEVRGYHNYYKFANNSTVLQRFRYVMEYSMYKTYANKYQSSIGKVKKKFCMNGRFSVSYQTKSGINTAVFYKESLAKQDILKVNSLSCTDALPNVAYIFGRTKLTDRLKFRTCEMCGKENVPLEMHHVKKLKDLKGKRDWERLMISRQRKTLALCENCHNTITQQQRKDSTQAKKN